MEEEFIEPSAAEKKKAWLLIFISIAAGLLFLPLAQGYLNLIDGLPKCEQLSWLVVTLYALMLLPFGVGLWLLRQARLIFKNSQFPLPDARVIRRTKIHRGQKARWLAVTAITLSLMLIGGSAFMTYRISQFQSGLAGCSPNESFKTDSKPLRG